MRFSRRFVAKKCGKLPFSRSDWMIDLGYVLSRTTMHADHLSFDRAVHQSGVSVKERAQTLVKQELPTGSLYRYYRSRWWWRRMDTAHAYTLEDTTELSVAKEEFKFNAAHFVVLEVSATGLFRAPAEVHYSVPSFARPSGWPARARIPAWPQLPCHGGASRRG